MNTTSYENLKAIRFAGQLLPKWAQLLDLAARLCAVSEEAVQWFSALTAGPGAEYSWRVTEFCSLLRASIQQHREPIVAELQRSLGDAQPSQIIEAWLYALDTMIQEAPPGTICSWIIEGVENVATDDSDGGDITLRRV